jgi:hypothetical protein
MIDINKIEKNIYINVYKYTDLGEAVEDATF